MKIPSREEQQAISQEAGRRFASARLASGLSQIDAARLLGYSNSTKLSKIESGSHSSQIPIWAVRKAAEIYGVSCGYLLASDSPDGAGTDKVKKLMLELHEIDSCQINSLLHEAENDRTALNGAVRQLSQAMDGFERTHAHLLGLPAISNAVTAVTVAMAGYQQTAPVQRVFPQDLTEQVRAYA